MLCRGPSRLAWPVNWVAVFLQLLDGQLLQMGRRPMPGAASSRLLCLVLLLQLTFQLHLDRASDELVQIVGMRASKAAHLHLYERAHHSTSLSCSCICTAPSLRTCTACPRLSRIRKPKVLQSLGFRAKSLHNARLQVRGSWLVLLCCSLSSCVPVAHV